MRSAGLPRAGIRAEDMTMTEAQTKIGRAQGAIAAAGGVHIGDLCSWNISGVDASRERVEEIFRGAGLGDLVAAIRIDSAITRAAAEGKRPNGLFTRPFERPNSDTPASVGIYRVHSRDGEGGDNHVCVARVRAEVSATIGGQQDARAVALTPEGHVGPEDEEAMGYARDIAARANHLLTHVASKDVSAAMIKALGAIGACPLRERGGFYLIPPANCHKWRTLSGALESVGVERILIEMHDAPSNVAAARRAAAASLEADLAELQKELRASVEYARTSDRKRDVALKRRIAQGRELASKADLFEHLLQEKASEIRQLARQHAQCFEQVLDDDLDFVLPGCEPENVEGVELASDEPSEAGASAPGGHGTDVVAAAGTNHDAWVL